MAVELSPKMQAFTQEVFPGDHRTNRKNGSVEIVPVWFEQTDGSFWINGGTNRGWVQAPAARSPRITLLLIDPKNMWRWTQVEGRMVNWGGGSRR